MRPHPWGAFAVWPAVLTGAGGAGGRTGERVSRRKSSLALKSWCAMVSTKRVRVDTMARARDERTHIAPGAVGTGHRAGDSIASPRPANAPRARDPPNGQDQGDEPRRRARRRRDDEDHLVVHQ